MKEEPEEKFRWLVMFVPRGKIYTYMYKTVPQMTEIIKFSHEKHGFYPYRAWVIVDDEVQKVVIT